MIKSAFYELRSFDQSSVSGEKREAESAIIAFYNCLKAQVQKQINEAEQNMRYADRFFFDNNGSAIELLTEMNAAIHNLSSSIQIYSAWISETTVPLLPLMIWMPSASPFQSFLTR